MNLTRIGAHRSGYQRLMDQRSMSVPTTRPASQASTVTILTNVTNDETDSYCGEGESPRVEEKELPGSADAPPAKESEETKEAADQNAATTPDEHQRADSLGGDEAPSSASQEQPRGSVSNENNILLDPDVLTDHVTQVLVLTVLATLVKYTTDENEVRILYEYLAEASVVFPKVFPVIHSLLDAKITNVLSLCHDKTILASVQAIIENMISCEDTSQQQLHFLQSCGFGGLWRFAGFFTKSNCNAENVDLFMNCLEALVETWLPRDETDQELTQYPSMLSGIT